MMENLVLYRKYRPQSFSEVIGQDHIVTTLTNSLDSHSISHAYLFSGPKGSGKTTMARIFAKAINCLKPDVKHEPCNTCDSCLEIMGAKSMDLMEIDAASNTSVENVRELIEGIKFSPIKSKYKIFIIDECHQLSKSAANALLKTLEEPPAHAIFMMATTEVHKMIPTIISRCQRFDFKKLQVPEIIKKLEFILKKEQVKYEPSALSLIAFNARGSFRDAESLLDKCINFSSGTIKTNDIKELLGIVDAAQVSTLVDFVIQKNTKEAVGHVNVMAEQGVDLQEFAKTLVFYTRQLLLLKISENLLNPQTSGFSQEEMIKMKEQAANLSERDIHTMLESFIEAENKTKYASIMQLPLELAIVDLTYREA